MHMNHIAEYLPVAAPQHRVAVHVHHRVALGCAQRVTQSLEVRPVEPHFVVHIHHTGGVGGVNIRKDSVAVQIQGIVF